MINAADYKPSLGFGLLLQGPPKSGKTTLALNFPGVGCADCDNTLSGPVRWFKENRPEKLKDIWIQTINMTEDGKEVPDDQRWERLIKAINLFLAKPEVKTILIDGLSSVSQYLMDHIISKKTSGEKRMTIADWVPFRELLSKLVVNTRATKRMVIVTAHEEVNKNDTDGSLLVTPNIPSKLAGSIGGFFSDVWRCEPGNAEGVYVVRAQPKPLVPSLGNSLGLKPDVAKGFIFNWKEFEQLLYKYEKQS